MELTDKASFRDAMAHVGAAVNIITTDGPAGRAGFTASAVCSVTDTPPTLLVCLNRSASVWPRFGEKRFKHHCLLLTSYRSAIAVYDAYVGRRVDEPSRDRRMIRPDINSLVLLPCVQNCFCGFHL